jgi:hypothetical protein
LQAQARGTSGPIKGGFIILGTGDSVHADALHALVGCKTSAEEVVIAIRRRRPTSVSPVNANILALELVDAEGAAGQRGA